MAKKFSVQFSTNRRVALTTGHVVRFEAGVPREVSEKIYRAAIAAGGIDGKVKLEIPSPDDDDDDDEPQVKEDSGVLKIATAMRDIIDSGDPDQITGSGKVKLEVLSEMTGMSVDSSLRDEAQKLLDEGIV